LDDVKERVELRRFGPCRKVLSPIATAIMHSAYHALNVVCDMAKLSDPIFHDGCSLIGAGDLSLRLLGLLAQRRWSSEHTLDHLIAFRGVLLVYLLRFFIHRASPSTTSHGGALNDANR
jgi:hypothetical protein